MGEKIDVDRGIVDCLYGVLGNEIGPKAVGNCLLGFISSGLRLGHENDTSVDPPATVTRILDKEAGPPLQNLHEISARVSNQKERSFPRESSWLIMCMKSISGADLLRAFASGFAVCCMSNQGVGHKQG